MIGRSNRALGPLILAALAVVYFILYPSDFAAILDPLDLVINLIGKILGLTMAISPWLYGVAGVAMLGWTAVRIWAPRRESSGIPPV